MPSAPPVPRVKPAALRPGDTVGIVAPASNIKRDWLEAGCAALERMGYKPFYFDSIFEKELYFAGSVERRLREFEEMFVREDVRAIICARGGYGSNYLLERIDLGKVRANPKVFVGYSDITTLLTYFTDATGLITFHGPMVTKDFSVAEGMDLPSWNSAVTGDSSWDLKLGADSGVKALAAGRCEGTLYGGCLSMLVESLGTPYEIHTDDTILFIEDIAAKPYQIDRMLMQLKLAGKLAGVRGLVFGQMLDCVQHKDQGYTLEEVILRIVGDLQIPIAYGLRSGHVSRQNVTLPIGVRASLAVSNDEVTLKILEAATTPAAVRSMKV